MIKRYQRLAIKSIYVCIDLVCICFAIYLACKIRHTTLPFDITFTKLFFDSTNQFQYLFVFWMVTTILFLNKRELYQTRREIYEGVEIGLVIKSVCLATLVVIVAIYALKIVGFPRTVLFIGTCLIIVFLSAWRFFKRMFVEYIVRRGYNNFNALIIGAGRVGIALQKEIEKNPQMGIRIKGFLSNENGGEDNVEGAKILGSVSDFKRIAKRQFINKIFITIHHDSESFLKLLEDAKELGVAVRVIPQGFELMSGELTKYNIGIIPVLEYSDVIPLHKQVGKRLFDFIISSVCLLILLPFIIVLAIAIKVDSRGPIFYLSKRYGRNGQKFNMLKFRSMELDAEKKMKSLEELNEVDGPIFKIKNDPRVTKIGRWLRRYSLDELPQIINVIKGEMSLVGPRPFPIEQVEREDLKQLKRLEVRPGITGLWQIRGRSDISFARLVRWDTWYINNWSFWLDLNILFLTLPVVIKGRGAY